MGHPVYIDDLFQGQGAGQQFYENLCMKAVNQCIGRAVRHRNDYATVLLLDERFGRTSTSTALPGWIKRSLKTCESKEAFNLISEVRTMLHNNIDTKRSCNV